MTSRDLLAMLLVVQNRMLLAFTAGMHWYLISLRKEQREQMQGLYIGLSTNFNILESLLRFFLGLVLDPFCLDKMVTATP